ncbi:MAG: ABC transporter ATP-binding protein [Candidatus Riflebacteria bacterium HGW-Riflebacteria-2]|jgi:ATP-binding cassette subfamily B protein|nr:MAG: ABC transporter ATP-binding protein [Candidatus Riflebacteria bacterium HGW-Riflebacteria-2]
MECLRPYWRTTLAAYLALLAINAVALTIPQFIRWIVDSGIARQDTDLISRSVLGLLLLALLKSVFTYFQGCWTETASQNVACDLRNAIHRQLARLSFSWHDRSETGQILTRAIQDVERIRFVTGRAFLRIIDGLVLVIGSSVLLLLINPLLALLAMATMPLLAWRAMSLGRRLRPMSLVIQKQLGKLTARLEQNLRGVRIVKAFAQEDAEIARFARANRRWFSLSALTARLQAFTAPQIDMIANFSTVIVIGYGGYLVTCNQLTTGELVAFATYLGQLTVPVRRMGNIVPAVALAMTSGTRIFEILDTLSEVTDAPDARPLPPVKGKVIFEDVVFGYVHNHRILQGVSFAVRPGQIVALLGTTGSGKSTIINLIPRFYDPTAGRILIDEHDIRKVTLASLREQIGTVLQETTLFATTIRENILFGRPGAGEEAMLAAARAAQADDFIREMPQGYDTLIGERGVTLSGGQKQRVAIARTLLRDPRILILDDATASVDTATERQIQIALEHLMAGRTCFVIAQRLSTLRKADMILILEHGQLVAQGTHAELMKSSGLYAELYHQQERAGGL